MRHISTLLVLLIAATAFAAEQEPSVASPEEVLFLNPSRFKVYTSKDETKWASIRYSDEREKKSVQYQTKLKNWGKVDINNLRVDYCIYSDHKKNGENYTEIKSYRREIGVMKPASLEKIDTRKCSSYKNPDDHSLNETVGVRFKVYMTLPDGREITREAQLPKSLSKEKYPWEDYENKLASTYNEPENEEGFLDPASFLITTDAIETKWREYGDYDDGRKKKAMHYRTTLNNQSKNRLAGLKVDYCIYSDREMCGDKFVEIFSHNSLSLGSIKPSEFKTFRTGTHTNYERPSSKSSTSIAGICFRVRLPMAGGREAVREIRVPESLSAEKYPWKDYENTRKPPKNSSKNKTIFLNQDSFSLSLNKTETEWEEDDEIVDGRLKKWAHYRLTLRNNSQEKLTGLRVEHCTYRDRDNYSEGGYISTYSYGRRIGSINPGTTVDVSTGYNASYKSPDNDYVNEVLGMRIRVYLPMSDGKDVMREISFPESLSEEDCPWQDPEKKY